MKRGNIVTEHKDLRSGFAIKLNVALPCGMPLYIVEYQREDYMIGRFVLAENGRTGLLDECLGIKHTFRSIIYYFVI